MNNNIYPCIWCNNNALEMAEFYTKIFGGKIVAETDLVTTFTLFDQKFITLNGGDFFKPNPSVSFMLMCASEDEVVKYYNALKDGSKELMPLDEYYFSKKYVWLEDKYNVSWQIIFMEEMPKQKIIPSLMFVGQNNGKLGEGLDFYTSLFPNSKIEFVSHYEEKATPPQKPTDIIYSLIKLNDYYFTLMESAYEHQFDFSEGMSIVIETKDQAETDFYWDNFTKDGGQESQCGWLKDKYGMNWQIVPKRLAELTDLNPDKQKSAQVVTAMLMMKKIIITDLEKANAEDFITINTIIKAPIHKVWQIYHNPEDINNWNHASDDWACKDAKVDLKVGGKYESTMYAKDGSVEFTFGGVYTKVLEDNFVEIKLDDGRKMQVAFTPMDSDVTRIDINFNPETENPKETQKQGWQAILDNFKTYCEENRK